MIYRRRFLFWTAVLLIICAFSVHSRPVGELEFIDRPIQEILSVLADSAGMSITPDETVKGRTSFYYPGGTGEEAFELFLNRHGLHLFEEAGVIVSRVKIQKMTSGALRIDARDVTPEEILKTLANRREITILFDTLPAIPQTIHLQETDPEGIIRVLISPFPYLELKREGAVFRIEDSRSLGGPSGQNYFSGRVEEEGDGYSLDIEKGRFRQILGRLFALTGSEYSFLGLQNPLVEDLHIEGRSFDECLQVVMEQGISGFREAGGIFYIYDLPKDETLRRFRSRVVLPLKHRTVKEIAALIPPWLSPSGGLIQDYPQNSLIVAGIPEEIALLQHLVEELDAPRPDWVNKNYSLGFCETSEVERALPGDLQMVSVVSLVEQKQIWAGMPAGKQRAFEAFLTRIDRPVSWFPVALKYIRGEELIESLPPGISREDIEITRDSSLIYLKGNEEKLGILMEALKRLDKPIPQIRYDLLVIQYSDEEQFNWDFSIANSVSDAADQTSYLGDLGNTLGLNFDITSAFGYAFSLKLNSDIDHSRARVVADTTLNGLSGETVSFQNTDTYRYRDTVKDLESGSEEVTGVSREITSGLFLEIDGWGSGDGMITMQVSTTVSKRGEVSSEATGILPPTSEKIVHTYVRTEAGKPVVIGGLIQQEKEVTITKPPLIGWIPLLGWLFQDRKESFKNSEMVIYIIPHLEKAMDAASDSLLEEYFEKYAHFFP